MSILWLLQGAENGMKKASDPRHKARIKIVKELFAESFIKQPRLSQRTTLVLKNLSKIDQLVSKAAPEWPIEKIAKINLAILRLAVYEMSIDKNTPVKVIIDEAVEIAKLFGNERSPSFVNGVLGTITKEISTNYVKRKS